METIFSALKSIWLIQREASVVTTGLRILPFCVFEFGIKYSSENKQYQSQPSVVDVSLDRKNVAFSADSEQYFVQKSESELILEIIIH